MGQIVTDLPNLCTIAPVQHRSHSAMSTPTPRHEPVLPLIRIAQPPRAKLIPIAGGRSHYRRVSGEQRRPARVAARCHTPQELGLLVLCAACVAFIGGLTVFTIMRDRAWLDRSTPIVEPMNR
jgi:hypothetical protein